MLNLEYVTNRNLKTEKRIIILDTLLTWYIHFQYKPSSGAFKFKNLTTKFVDRLAV
jgi:hypothetical protein